MRSSATCDVFSGDKARETGINWHPENSNDESKARYFAFTCDTEPLSGERRTEYGARKASGEKTESIDRAGNSGFVLP
ncbi:MAG: hypothetical protein [Bacteriophage sp.]|nr:MAG: hypothetical protein [Bacteriophage sp.]